MYKFPKTIINGIKQYRRIIKNYVSWISTKIIPFYGIKT